MKLDIKGIAILAFIAGIAAFLLLSSDGGVKQAPAITVETIDGQQIDLAAMQGKPYLVNFWATDCPSCVQEIPHLVELQDKLQDTGFNVLAVALPHDNVDAIKAMREQKGMQYLIAHDAKGEWGRAFGGIRVTPTSFLVSPEGKIVYQKLGDLDTEKLAQQVREMVKG